jgi:integrase
VYARRYGPAPAPGEKDARPVRWWIEYWHRGTQFRESAGSSVRKTATDLLKQRLGEVGTGAFTGPSAERLGFEALVEMLRADYTRNGRRSLGTALACVAHLRRAFGSDRVADLAPHRFETYAADRLESGAARATVQRELATMARMLNLAHRAGRIGAPPRVPRLKVENTRSASFTAAELDAVLDVLTHGRPATAKDPAARPQPDLAAAIRFAGITGWRLRSEVLGLAWKQVAPDLSTVWLPPGAGKTGKPRVFPLDAVPELKALMERRREATDAAQRSASAVVPLVFHRSSGQPIRAYRRAWGAACRLAGLPDRRPHDLRRTAARTLRGLGMSDRDIAELCGWDTPEMVSRYLGRDPAGVAERLRRRMAESDPHVSRTFSPPAAEAGGR